jgi:anti-sigma regulatory factor (Ser/Thr protein kinase)
LITQLEQEESDAEELEQLFRLDHLATRMRRNAESLLVLAGEEPARTWTAPVQIGDVLRAALGEVEQYSRVRLQHIDDTTVIGRAVADVSHIVAELVENALTFSPPDSPVTIAGRHSDEGFEVTIADAGIGMSEDEIERANVRLRAAESFTIAPSRYLGHYVVAQLALRHQIGVSLRSSEPDGHPGSGVTATVVLPFTLLDDGMGGPVAEMPSADAFSFGDIALADQHEPAQLDGVATAAEAVEVRGPVLPVEASEPTMPVALAPETLESEPLDVPDWITGAGAGLTPEPEPASEPESEPVPEEESVPPVVPITPSASSADRRPGQPVTNFFAEAAAAIGASAPPKQQEASAASIETAPTTELPAPVPAPPAADRGAFAAMLHATGTSKSPKEWVERAEPEPLVEPAPPQPEPVEAFVQSRPDPELESDSAAGDIAFVPAPIQDDLLPQLPRRHRRGKGGDAPAPQVPAQVLRIAAAQHPADAVADPMPAPVAAAPVAEPQEAAAGAPPLPRRELDAEPVAPPRLPVPTPIAEGDTRRPNYELFAAFRAATDQGKADAVRRGSDGGGA